MSDIASWIADQKKAVEVSGRAPEALRLVGPDDRVWGQWSLATEGLADAVEGLRVTLGEQLPNGKHRGQLVVHDNRGEQWSALPITLHGRNASASTAAQETRTLQQATAITVNSLEAVILSLRNENERLVQRNEEMSENVAKLVEVVMGYQTTNTEVDLMIRRHEESAARLDKLATSATPLLTALAGVAGKAIQRKAEGKDVVRARPRVSGKQSTNGTAVHGSVSATGAEADGASDSANGRRRSARRSKGPTKTNGKAQNNEKVSQAS